MGLREEFRAALRVTAKQKPRAIEVKGWPRIFVRMITVEEAEEQAADIADPKDKNRIARGAARVICDENCQLLGDVDDKEYVAELASQPWPLLRKAIEEPPEGN